jgi:DNA-binding transcriptional ArsR family regulator
LSADAVGPVFAALADGTRREMVEALLRDGETSVPALTAVLPISRQAVAKHLATLGHAGLVERAPGPGREVHYRLRAGALEQAGSWLARAQAGWDVRLGRLKQSVEETAGVRARRRGRSGRSGGAPRGRHPR